MYKIPYTILYCMYTQYGADPDILIHTMYRLNFEEADARWRNT